MSAAPADPQASRPAEDPAEGPVADPVEPEAAGAAEQQTAGAAETRVLAVNARDAEEVRVALLVDGRIHDLRWAQPERASLVGNLYLGVVRQVEPGLDSAFVDFGAGRAGFLHVGNVHPGYGEAEADPVEVASRPTAAAEAIAGELDGGAAPAAKPPRISEHLQVGQQVLVQVVRDPVRGKGATLTTFVSLAGRLLVWMPSLGRIGVSRRIQDDKERRRLRSSVEACGPPERAGLIARTAAAGRPKRDLQRDLEHVQRQWQLVTEAAAAARAEPDEPALLLAELSPAVRAVRDLMAGGVERVVVDSPEHGAELERFLVDYLPRHRPGVELYRKQRPLFEALDLERDYQLLFRPRVPVGSGASIVIHETEALTAIDVNSGRIDEGSLEATALAANKLAAVEVARQIRLRDLGGILVVDFIDMTQAAHRREVESLFRQELRADRARFKAGRLGSFGLMSLTRRRLGTGLPRATELPCAGCGGSGSAVQHRAGAMRALRRLRAVGPERPWRLRAHPGVIQHLRAHHQDVLDDFSFEVKLEEDPVLAPGELTLK